MHTSSNSIIDNGMELKTIGIDSISIPTFHPRLDYGSLEDLQGSMRRDGLQDPVLVFEIEPDRYGVIDGARRLKAALAMGWPEIACLVKTGLTEPEAAHLAYVKNHERKTLTPIEEAIHIRRMQEEYGFTMQELTVKGYGSTAKISQSLKLLGLAKPVQAMIAKGDLTKDHGVALAALPTEKEQMRMAKHAVDFHWSGTMTKLKVGNYLRKDAKKKRSLPSNVVSAGEVPGVYFKDAKDMGELPSACVHMILTSPPYLIGQDYEVGTPFDEHVANVQAVMAECARVLVPGGVMAVNLSDIHNFRGRDGKAKKTQWVMMGHRYQSWLKRGKVHLADVIIWRKRPAPGKEGWPIYSDLTGHTAYRFGMNWEPIYIFRKEGVRTAPEADIAMRSRITREQFTAWTDGVWDIEPAHPKMGHPAIWPDRLAARLIRMFSYEADLVLDPFLGSGTTVKVARDLGREGIGYERALQYKPVIMERLGITPEAPAAYEAPAESMVAYAERSIASTDREAQQVADEAAAFDRSIENAAEPAPAV